MLGWNSAKHSYRLRSSRCSARSRRSCCSPVQTLDSETAGKSSASPPNNLYTRTTDTCLYCSVSAVHCLVGQCFVDLRCVRLAGCEKRTNQCVSWCSWLVSQLTVSESATERRVLCRVVISTFFRHLLSLVNAFVCDSYTLARLILHEWT